MGFFEGFEKQAVSARWAARRIAGGMATRSGASKAKLYRSLLNALKETIPLKKLRKTRANSHAFLGPNGRGALKAMNSATKSRDSVSNQTLRELFSK